MNLPTRLFLPWRRAAASHTLVGFVDEILRGCGQVMFQNSPITGLCFLIGLFVGGWQFGAYGLLGTAASSLAARWIGVPSSSGSSSVVAIPRSLLAALLVLNARGVTINTMVLAGFVIALGDIVDDAIVDVENVFRRLRENAASDKPHPRLSVIARASGEVRNSILYATVLIILMLAWLANFL